MDLSKKKNIDIIVNQSKTAGEMSVFTLPMVMVAV